MVGLAWHPLERGQVGTFQRHFGIISSSQGLCFSRMNFSQNTCCTIKEARYAAKAGKRVAIPEQSPKSGNARLMASYHRK